MSDSVADLLAALPTWTPEEESPPLLEGAVDRHRSGEDHLFFAVDPCRGPWFRVPASAVAAVRLAGDLRCGPVVHPRVQLELDPGAEATPTVLDAVRAGVRGAGSRGGGEAGARLGGGPADESASHDVRVEVRPEGKLYRIRLQLEGHEVKRVDWDADRKVYVADIPGLPVEDALDVVLQAWGNKGATLTLSVEVDGRALKPEMEATVTDRPGEARRSYRL